MALVGLCVIVSGLFHSCLGSGKIEVHFLTYSDECLAFVQQSFCDITFTFCLSTPQQSNSTTADNCTYASTGGNHVLGDKNILDLESRTSIGDIVNPWVVHVKAFVEPFVFLLILVEADDYYVNKYYQTWRTILAESVWPSEGKSTWAERMMYQSRYSMTFRVRMYCDPFYFTHKCDTYCKDDNSSTGHYTCESNTGNKVCLPGWQGENCTEDIDECMFPSPCVFGECINGHGSYVCICNGNYTGSNCSQLKNPCLPNPCLNGGSCFPHSSQYSFVCHCSPEWEGQICDRRIQCALGPCLSPCANSSYKETKICTCVNSYNDSSCETTEATLAPIDTTVIAAPTTNQMSLPTTTSATTTVYTTPTETTTTTAKMPFPTTTVTTPVATTTIESTTTTSMEMPFPTTIPTTTLTTTAAVEQPELPPLAPTATTTIESTTTTAMEMPVPTTTATTTLTTTAAVEQQEQPTTLTTTAAVEQQEQPTTLTTTAAVEQQEQPTIATTEPTSIEATTTTTMKMPSLTTTTTTPGNAPNNSSQPPGGGAQGTWTEDDVDFQLWYIAVIVAGFLAVVAVVVVLLVVMKRRRKRRRRKAALSVDLPDPPLTSRGRDNLTFENRAFSGVYKSRSTREQLSAAPPVGNASTGDELFSAQKPTAGSSKLWATGSSTGDYSDSQKRTINSGRVHSSSTLYDRPSTETAQSNLYTEYNYFTD